MNKKHLYPFFWLVISGIFLSGCFNDRGVSLRYYDNCEEYYDLQGYFHKKCDPNLFDYSDVKEAIKPVQDPRIGEVSGPSVK